MNEIDRKWKSGNEKSESRSLGYRCPSTFFLIPNFPNSIRIQFVVLGYAAGMGLQNDLLYRNGPWEALKNLKGLTKNFQYQDDSQGFTGDCQV